jgi:branched-chain amino acid transport system permease protein
MLDRAGRARLWRRLAWAPLAGLAALPWIVSSQYWTSILILILFKVLLTSSLRLNHLMGFVSLGQVGFMLVGAYTSALLVMRAGVPIPVGLAAAAALAFALAFLLGYAFLRVKGIYFVVLTFLTAETVRLVAGYARTVTGGRTGLSQIPTPGELALGPLRLDLDQPSTFYVLLLVITAAVTFLLHRLERSRLGFYFRAIEESEAVCAAAGMNTTLVKTVNFAASAAIAGLTGGLWAHYETVLTPSVTSVFGPMSSIFLLVYLYAGGTHHLGGPALGTAALIVLGELARVSEEHVPIVVGAVMIAVVLLMPDGIAGSLARLRVHVHVRLRVRARAKAGAA